MNGNRNGRSTKVPLNKTIKVAPTTRAIRAALAVSATMLALAGSGVAYAGSCSVSALNTVSCNGVFTDTVTDYTPANDLTLILGDTAPTSVTPASSHEGLAASWGGDMTVVSYADITTVDADGVNLSGTGSATFSNYGIITTDASGDPSAQAVDVYANGDATVTNAGSIYATSVLDDATAVLAETQGLGDIEVVNSGTISAEAYGKAEGVDAWAYGDGSASITNSGSITATSYYGVGGLWGDAIGAYSYTDGLGNATVTNTGTGSITATSYAGNAYGIRAWADVDGDANVTNDGSVTANGYTGAVGVYANSYNYWAVVANGVDGSIDAHAYGYDTASATGVSAIGFGAAVYSEGSISATAEASGDYGSADATGVFAAGIDTVDFSSASGSSVYAGASGYYAYATGVLVAGNNNVYVDNGGDIDAFASGVYGNATGMAVLAIGDVAVYNSGDVTAEFDGDYGSAAGVEVLSAFGDVYFQNSGSITASDSYGSTGVYLASKYYTDLVNDGTITADTAILTGYSHDNIWNYGTINGAIVTDVGDDWLYNADSGTWNATGASYFGAGDDYIYNNGTIHMTDAAIYLGTYSEYGNNFVNYGTVKVSGDNWIDMGEGWDEVIVDTLIPSLNPNPFYNYGVIDFQDGHPDDTLTIVGDFAGDGDINVDVSAIHKTSDLLYIDGSVVDGTSTINPDVLDTPTSEFTEIPMVYVTGNSGSGNFALGDVGMDLVHTFLTFDFNLVSHVDTTNETDDRYALTIDVTGLSDPGVLAASVVPGVQSLANEQVGTWRQRMGVINKFQDSTFAMWARWFQNDGTITPDHVATNFGQGGNFDFDQKNSGFEVGADFSVNEEFSFGVLGGQADADQDLNAPGSGSTRIDADTYGVYATWLSNGFYVDGSYRWMNFTADSTSAAGVMTVKGDAETFNIEAGYAWTLEGGLQIEPQAQYTNTNVSNVDAVTLGQTAFQAADGTSEVGRLGVSFRKGYGDRDNGTLWTPYATLSAVWEMDGENAYAINGSNFLGHTSTDGTSGLLELGLTAQTGNLSVFGGINWQDGGALDSFVGGQLGVRYTFGHAAPAPAPVAPPPAKTCADLDDDGDGVNNCNDKCPGSAAGQAIGPDGCPVPLTIDLKGVNFDFDKATLRPDAVAILDEAISILGKYPELKVEVAGHTDSVGTDEYNQKLSERRAATVFDYLSSHGIGTERMVGPVGYGESKPIAPNTNEDGSDNPEGRAKNRRTELNVQN